MFKLFSTYIDLICADTILRLKSMKWIGELCNSNPMIRSPTSLWGPIILKNMDNLIILSVVAMAYIYIEEKNEEQCHSGESLVITDHVALTRRQLTDCDLWSSMLDLLNIHVLISTSIVKVYVKKNKN